MLLSRSHNTVASLVIAGMVCLTTCITAPDGQAATPAKLAGAITGFVTDAAGVPQMGAAVFLFNRQERQFERAITDERGVFKFLGLSPDLYSVKVTLASFVPALKKGILVQPGMASVLNVNLNTLFSSIQFAYPPIDSGSLMSDEWKWVLRSTGPTRPVLRFNGDALARDTTAPHHHTAVFSDTRGVLKVSAGEGSLASGVANETDLGTAFALATSLYGSNNVQFSGNVGYGSQTGAPTTAFRTSYSRNLGIGSPEVSVTMRQLFVPGRVSAAIGGNESAMPMLRSMSASLDDVSKLSDELTVQYGFTLNSISFLDHLNYASPYARITYSLGDAGEVEFAYTSGDARPDLAGKASDVDMQQQLSGLGMFPRISLRDGRAKIQRGENFEFTYSRKVGSRTYQGSAFREHVSNAALSMVAPDGMYAGGDILPDLFNGTSTFNAGNYGSMGYSMAVTQSVGPHVTAMLMYESAGALTVDDRELVSNSPDELRSMIHSGRRRAATARVTAVSPWTGTHIIASYQATVDHRWASAGHLYNTDAIHPMPGMNLYLRQPIPRFSMPWRMEATADLRNMLAQGYLPVGVVGGQSLLLVETPRSFRGGLSFIF